MNKASWLVAAAVLAAVGGAAPVRAGDEAAPPATATAAAVKLQTVCPVMGGEINRAIFVDHGGQRVYFCCNACPPLFKKDPATYLKKLEADGVTLDKTPQATTTNAPAAGPHQRKDGPAADAHTGHHP
jgi:YHS domain-containing protein